MRKVYRSGLVKLLFMLALSWFTVGLGAWLEGQMTAYTPLSIFARAGEMEYSSGRFVFAIGIFIGSLGWPIACFLAGLIIGSLYKESGAKWGLGVAFVVQAFHLRALIAVHDSASLHGWRQDGILLPFLAAEFVALLLSLVLGYVGGYSGERLVVAFRSKKGQQRQDQNSDGELSSDLRL